MTYTIRIPDFGSVNRLLSDVVFAASRVLPLSSSCWHGTALLLTEGVLDDSRDLSFPEHKNQRIYLKTESTITHHCCKHVASVISDSYGSEPKFWILAEEMTLKFTTTTTMLHLIILNRVLNIM